MKKSYLQYDYCENVVRSEKRLVKELHRFFSQEEATSADKPDNWESLGSYLKWRLLPSILQLVPAWPHHRVWCDGVTFFYQHVEQPNYLHAIGSSWWQSVDQGLEVQGKTGGVELAELIEIEMRLHEKENANHVDYKIKIWAKGLCYQLSPHTILVSPSCSDMPSTPNFDCLLKTIKQPAMSRGFLRSIASLLGGFTKERPSTINELFTDKDKEIRCAIVTALERKSIEAQFAIPLITKALQDEDLEVQHLAANVLWQRVQADDTFLPLLEQSTPVLLELFGDKPKSLRTYLIHVILAFLGKSQTRVVDAMVDYLADPRLRGHATYVLWGAGVSTAKMVKIFQAGLDSENVRWRISTAFSLWYFGIDNGKAFIELSTETPSLQDSLIRELLDHEFNPTFRQMLPEVVIPVLNNILENKQTNQRIWCKAASELAYIHRCETDNSSQQLLQTLVPKLLQYLKYDDELTQCYAIKALGAIGKDASSAIPLLLTIVYDQDADDMLRGPAAEALVNIEPNTETIVILFNFLRQQKDYTLNANALPIIKLLGTHAIPLLYSVLLSMTPNETQASCNDGEVLDYEIFDLLSEFENAAVSTLGKLTKNQYWVLMALSALGKTNAEAAVPYLIDYLSDSDYSIRANAAEALGNLGILSEEAIPFLTKAMNDSDSIVRIKAIIALGKIGNKAIPILLAKINSSDELTQGWITTSLKSSTSPLAN